MKMKTKTKMKMKMKMKDEEVKMRWTARPMRNRRRKGMAFRRAREVEKEESR